MLKRLGVASVGAALLFAPSREAETVPPRGPVELSFAVIANAADGSSRTRCEAAEEVQTFLKTDLSVAVSAGSEIRCGGDFLGTGASEPHALPGAPILFAKISAAARSLPNVLTPESVLALDLSLSIRELTGLGAREGPVYRESAEKRSLLLAEGGHTLVPLLLSDGAEAESLETREVFLKLAVSRMEVDPGAAYGVISVTSEMRGAELLLDGGVVGRVSAGGGWILRNVPAGLRDVRARDGSGHEVRKRVRVEANRSVLVDLSLHGPARDAVSYRVVPLGKNAQGSEEYQRKRDGAVVVKVPAGEFLMGNKETERTPLEHRVVVSDFLIDKTKMT